MKKIRLLGDDLSYIFDNFKPNSIQEKKYPKPKKGKRLTHGMMSKDHPKALRLYIREEDKGVLVGSLKKTSAERFWQYNNNHVFPPTSDLIRAGLFFHLDFYHGIALVLKGLWEEFYAKIIEKGNNLIEELTNYDKARIITERFEPNYAKVYEIINEYKKYEKAWEEEIEYYTEENFCSLVQEMILGELHLVGQDSKELAFFSENKQKEIRVLTKGSKEEQIEFWKKRWIWIQKQRELEEILLLIESERFKNTEITYKWLMEFGEDFLEIERCRYRIAILQMQIQIKKTEPKLSIEEIEEKTIEEIERFENEIKELEFELEIAPYLTEKQKVLEKGALKIDYNTIENYKKEYKKLLREIYLLIYPDKLKLRPEYNNLTQEQKEVLNELLQEVLKIKNKGLVFKEPYLTQSLNSLERLKEIKEYAKEILEIAGINIKTELIIKGDTIKERIEWLDNEILKLENAIEDARKELVWVTKDKEIARKKKMLEVDENTKEEIKKDLKAERKKLEKELKKLEKEFSNLFFIKNNKK